MDGVNVAGGDGKLIVIEKSRVQFLTCTRLKNIVCENPYTV